MGLSCKSREVLLSKLDQLLMGNTTSTDQNHTISSVVCLDVVDQVVSLDALDVLSRAEDSAS